MATPSQQAPPGQSLDDGDRPRPLTEAEKKANHIASEQKRRQAIREGFDRLSEIVPGLKGQARSEALVLNKTLAFARQLMLERKTLIEELDALGEPVDPEIRL
ncbi:Transcription factor [Madurella fahalii]|uniref:Transcription factor n=1 Tax=Madurella fahalii TaxID=1157608 RepID=A0ABQ0G105_9PEZI